MSLDNMALRAAENTQARVRPQRHARSLPLIVLGIGLLVIAYLVLQYRGWIPAPDAVDQQLFCVATVGGATLEVVKRYVENQRNV